MNPGCAPVLQVCPPGVPPQEGVEHTTGTNSSATQCHYSHEISTDNGACCRTGSPQRALCLLYSHYRVSLVILSTVRMARSVTCSSCTQEPRYGESSAKHGVFCKAWSLLQSMP